ncbi:MFS general substrate transporter [Lentithecium fluviatile CBS 122367]|uniref:MFS general substrate transporter n=1 Tax=Lentithecium fluviatile CBS 122367 TaxID=1168545 RepID=A0A6G1JA61_9PLEO|nr:MFS general substrate transporter [Lentithecium fluviatile CBS 122367]
MYDAKRDAPSSTSLSSDSIRSQDRPLENGDEVKEKGQDVAKTDEGGVEEGVTRKEEQKLTLQRSKSVTNAASIPDGGLWAWLQVLGGFFLLFNSWGIINTFGSYQAYYETDLLSSSNSSAISWIGSLQAFLLLFVGCLTGPVYDAGYFRTLLLSGSFFLVLGQMMLSLCTEYYQVLLAQAFCIGIGTGCLFVPSVAILSTYFTTKFAFAVGLAASGSSLGGVIYPIVFHKLLPQIGFAWTTRVIGFIILGTMVIPNACMRVRVLPAKTRSLLDLPAFKIPTYALTVFGFFVGFMGLYMPFFYAQVYALQRQITNENLAFYLLAVMNSTSVFGRIIPNYLADFLGPFNVVIPCALVTAILCFCFISVTSSAGIIVLMAFYGFFSGSFVSLPPTIIVHLSLNAREKIGTRLGQSFACVAVGLLVGTPIGGAILDSSGFTGVWVFGGVLLAASGVALLVSRILYKGWGFMVKA